MTNEPRYVIYDQWLAQETQATLAETFVNLKPQDSHSLRLIWEDQPMNSLSWLGQNLIRAWQTQFQAPCLVPRIWVETVKDTLTIDAHSDPVGMYVITPSSLTVLVDGLSLPLTQGQFLVIDENLDMQIQGSAQVMLFLLVPPGEGRQFATPPRGFSTAPKP